MSPNNDSTIQQSRKGKAEVNRRKNEGIFLDFASLKMLLARLAPKQIAVSQRRGLLLYVPEKRAFARLCVSKTRVTPSCLPGFKTYHGNITFYRGITPAAR